MCPRNVSASAHARRTLRPPWAPILRADGVFEADSVLAKHDENYMPKEVAEALKDKGHWQGGEGAAN